MHEGKMKECLNMAVTLHSLWTNWIA